MIIITISIKNYLIENITFCIFVWNYCVITCIIIVYRYSIWNKFSHRIHNIQNDTNEGNVEEWVFNIGNALTIPIYVIVFRINWRVY